VTPTTLEPLLVDVAGAARMLSIGHSLLYEMASDGRLGPMAIPFGRKKLYRIDELRRWVQEGCKPRSQWLGGRP